MKEMIKSCQRRVRSQAVRVIRSQPPLPRGHPSVWAYLPVEILIYIFEEVRDVYHPHLDIPKANSRWVHWDPGWLVLTQVCSRWRSIVTQTPALYASIPRASPLWLEEFIRRSRDAHLCVDLNLDPNHRGQKVTKRQRRSLQRLARNLHRIDELTIAGYQAYDFLSMAVEPAPHLHTLRLHAKQDQQMSHSAAMRPNFRFPPNLFQGTLPNLRHLVLSDISALDILPLLTENVTKLELTRDRHSECPRSIPLVPFLQTLRRMPHLKLLSVVNVLKELSDHRQPFNFDQYDALEPVDLPDLAELYIYCPSSFNCMRLLRKLRFDKHTVRLHIGSEIPYAAAFPPYITSPPADLPPFRVVKLVSSALPPSLTLSAWRTPPTPSSQPHPPHAADFCAEFRLWSLHHCAHDAYSLCSQLPLHTVELLSLGLHSPHGPYDVMGEYERLLRCFRAATRLELDPRCDALHANAALGALGLTTRDAAGHRQLLCPALREVHLNYTPDPKNSRPGDEMDSVVAYVAEQRLQQDRRSKLAEVVVLGRPIRCGTLADVKEILPRQYSIWAGGG